MNIQSLDFRDEFERVKQATKKKAVETAVGPTPGDPNDFFSSRRNVQQQLIEILGPEKKNHLLEKTRRLGNPFGQSSPIALFNKAHQIEKLLEKYGYENSSDGHHWRSPHQQSESFATRIATGDDGSEFWNSLSESDASAGLGIPTSSGHRSGDAFSLYTHFEHGGDQAAALAAWENERQSLASKRRRKQRTENVGIGNGSGAVPTTEILSLVEMLDRFVFIRDGSLVAERDNPIAILSLQDFRHTYAGSKHSFEGGDGNVRRVPATKSWLEHPARLEAETLTFRAGAARMTQCPLGRQALNLWVPRKSVEPPTNWQEFAVVFTDHVDELFGDDAGDFLDWVAHIEQKPGVLPHFGWVHISRTHGTGRNWMASVLTRVWAGHVAASLDLIGLLEGRFNDRLSRCLLAIVDEINEGGNSKYRHADTLRQMITAEVREINPKYGRRRTEHNAARWLIFSNHSGALPLDEHDRRFRVVSHEGPVKDPAYFTKLYALLCEQEFITSVAEFLKRRNIAEFNPGQRPPMNAAKRELIVVTQSEQDRICREIATHWPVDVITADEITGALRPHDGVTSPAARHAMDRAGIRRLKKVRTDGHVTTLYAVRDFANWAKQSPKKLKQELNDVSDAEKQRALDRPDE